MAARKRPTANNHLQEAMALLIRNQAAFVEQIARNDQEPLRLERQSDNRQIENNERFARIEQRLTRIEADLLKLPKTS